MCTVWKDSFLFLTNSTTENVTIDVFTHERNGWIGLAFGPSLLEKKLYLLHYSKSLLFFTNHTDPKNQINLKGEIDHYAGYKLDNLLHFSFNLPYSFLVKNITMYFLQEIR